MLGPIAYSFLAMRALSTYQWAGGVAGNNLVANSIKGQQIWFPILFDLFWLLMGNSCQPKAPYLIDNPNFMSSYRGINTKLSKKSATWVVYYAINVALA